MSLVNDGRILLIIKRSKSIHLLDLLFDVVDQLFLDTVLYKDIIWCHAGLSRI